MTMKPLTDFPELQATIEREYRDQIALMGQPPIPPKSKTDASRIFAQVRQGDGKYPEAIAAIMWHCGLSAGDAEDAIGDYTRFGRPE